MENMKKILFLVLIICSFIALHIARAEEVASESMVVLPSAVSDDAVGESETFRAKVVEIVAEKEKTRENGSPYKQQNVKLRALEGTWKNQDVYYYGIGDIDVASGIDLRVGDAVMAQAMIDDRGTQVFYVIEIVRSRIIYWLVGVFALVAILVGRKRGWSALISLIVTFLVIMKLIIPYILAGYNPLLVSLIGSAIILFLVIYLHWGFTRKSHLAFGTLILSLLITGLVSILFVYLARLSGSSNEEVIYLVGITNTAIKYQGLLLAGIIIGAAGVLDDVVISQISLVEQLKEANPLMKTGDLIRKALTVGVDHISSMVNTLFLAYAGASLPLLMLFNLKQEPFLTLSSVINNEMIATEIVRTLTGSIGLILAVPIATIVAVRYLGAKI